VSDTTDGRLGVTPLGNHRFRVGDGTRSQTGWAVQGSTGVWVFLDGRVFLVPASGADSGRLARSHDEAGLLAPMPATVLAIHVSPGQRVSRGDLLMVLEAMKMELPIKAPRDGVVKAIGCRVGELVQPETVLIELG
jgi:acetyl/propionyl-CoA carboxylase alpha subunit